LTAQAGYNEAQFYLFLFEASRDLGIMVVAVLATAVVLIKSRRLIFLLWLAPVFPVGSGSPWSE
jgi:hypothetical protein